MVVVCALICRHNPLQNNSKCKFIKEENWFGFFFLEENTDIFAPLSGMLQLSLLVSLSQSEQKYPSLTPQMQKQLLFQASTGVELRGASLISIKAE